MNTSRAAAESMAREDIKKELISNFEYYIKMADYYNEMHAEFQASLYTKKAEIYDLFLRVIEL